MSPKIKKFIHMNVYLQPFSAKQLQNPFKATEESALLLSGTSFLGRKTTAIVTNNASPEWPRSVHMCILNVYPGFFSHGRRRHASHGSAQQSAALL